MQTQKEILRDTVLTQMQPFLDAAMMDMLNQVLVSALFHVEVVEMETLPATRENTNEYILEVYKTKKVPKLSVKTSKYYLETIQHFIDFTHKSLLDVKDMDIEYYLQAYSRRGNKPITVNNERRNLSAFFTWMRKSHMIIENPVDGVEKYVEIEKPIEYLEDWEMEALRDACKIKVHNKVTQIEEYRECLRDRALIEFLRSTAMRVGECVLVNTADINWTTGELLIYGEKGRAYRTVCLDDTAKYHIKKYVDSRTDNTQALFVSVKGEHERLHRCGIRSALKAIADRSILTRRIYPHLFRKTTATNMRKRGCPGELIAFYLGHKNGNTKTVNKHYAATDPRQVVQAFWQYGAAA